MMSDPSTIPQDAIDAGADAINGLLVINGVNATTLHSGQARHAAECVLTAALEADEVVTKADYEQVAGQLREAAQDAIDVMEDRERLRTELAEAKAENERLTRERDEWIAETRGLGFMILRIGDRFFTFANSEIGADNELVRSTIDMAHAYVNGPLRDRMAAAWPEVQALQGDE